MSKYVISDIHGQYDKFIQILDLINFNDNDELYILGDVVDRGPNGIKIIEYIREHSNIHLIKGNHEDMLIDFFTTEEEYESWADHDWFYNGGLATYEELQELQKEKGEDYILDMIQYLTNLPMYLVVDNFILVHAGININFNKPTLDESLKISDDFDFLWNRQFIKADPKIEGHTVICGHTPTITLTGKSDIANFDNNILIDCGCVYGGKLGCLRLDDSKEFYI